MLGYVKKTKSGNAILAEARGHFPVSEVARKLNLPVKFIKECCEFAERNWHHHTGLYLRIKHYDLQAIKRWIEGDTSNTNQISFPIVLKQWRNKNIECNLFVYENVNVEWLEIKGTRNTPITEQRTEEGATVIDYKKSHVKIILNTGKQFNIGKNSYMFRVLDGDREITLNKRDDKGLKKLTVMGLAFEILEFFRDEYVNQLTFN